MPYNSLYIISLTKIICLEEFFHFLIYSKELSYEDRPDYEFWIQAFQERFVISGYEDNGYYEWSSIKTDIPFQKPIYEQDLNEDKKSSKDGKMITLDSKTFSKTSFSKSYTKTETN